MRKLPEEAEALSIWYNEAVPKLTRKRLKIGRYSSSLINLSFGTTHLGFTSKYLKLHDLADEYIRDRIDDFGLLN